MQTRFWLYYKEAPNSDFHKTVYIRSIMGQIACGHALGIPNMVNESFLGVESEALMLSSKQYCGISNGSASTSHDYSSSYVLTAMGLDEQRISSAVRISWGAKTNAAELKDNLGNLLEIARNLVF